MKLIRLRRKNGFTLIEMLIVITIVGILSSLALSALNPARNKAKDARIIEEVNQIRAYAETVYDGDYDELESLPAPSIENNSLRILVDDITSLGGELVLRKIGRPASRYIMYVRLNEKSANTEGLESHKYYCVDSSGHVSFSYAYLETALSCPIGN